MNYKETFAKYGIALPEILLPTKNNDVKTWSVIACDQYTQNADYWKNVKSATNNKPSMLHCILPEIYLEENAYTDGADSTDAKKRKTERLEKIHNTMNEYLQNGVFEEPFLGMVYLERKTAYGRTRKGLVTAIDLETYEWKPYSDALIRATEKTIETRIPPRMEIRQGAAIESPHIMLLVNDSKRRLIEETGALAKKIGAKTVYDGDLMLNSGHVTGLQICDEEIFNHIAQSLEEIANANTVEENGKKSTFLFAVGDGNHSLATAKAVWNFYKTQHPEDANNPLRYALVEIVNIFDEGLTFEPIHRVIFSALPEMLTRYLAAELSATVYDIENAQELLDEVNSSKEKIGLTYTTQDGVQKYVLLDAICPDLIVSYLQPILDAFLSIFGGCKPCPDNLSAGGGAKRTNFEEIDFIHGSDEVFRLSTQKDTIGILLPQISKDSFFATINTCGVLPRKSFSMGEASEKRFYLECRKLTQ